MDQTNPGPSPIGIGTGSLLPGLEPGDGTITDGSIPAPVMPPSTKGARRERAILPGSDDNGMFMPPM
jgi:hypothetical protein